MKENNQSAKSQSRNELGLIDNISYIKYYFTIDLLLLSFTYYYYISDIIISTLSNFLLFNLNELHIYFNEKFKLLNWKNWAVF